MGGATNYVGFVAEAIDKFDGGPILFAVVRAELVEDGSCDNTEQAERIILGAMRDDPGDFRFVQIPAVA